MIRQEAMNVLVGVVVCAVMTTIVGCRYVPDGETMLGASVLGDRIVSFESPYAAEPKEAKLLNEYGDLALFSGETEADGVFNAEAKQNGSWSRRNSLFLRWRMANGTNEWRLLQTSGGDWKDADGMNKWCKMWADSIRDRFDAIRASLSKDGRFIWLVCNVHNDVYRLICRFDLRENTLAVLTDGDSADEQPDGTILVKGKKTYLSDENGEPLGARWYDLWTTPDGKVVRKGRLWSADELANESSDKAN